MEIAPDGAIAEKIQGLKDSMRSKPIDRKLGAIEGRISKLLSYGEQIMHGSQIKIVEIRRSLKDFVRRLEEGISEIELHSGEMKLEKSPMTCDFGINQISH